MKVGNYLMCGAEALNLCPVQTRILRLNFPKNVGIKSFQKIVRHFQRMPGIHHPLRVRIPVTPPRQRTAVAVPAVRLVGAGGRKNHKGKNHGDLPIAGVFP